MVELDLSAIKNSKILIGVLIGFSIAVLYLILKFIGIIKWKEKIGLKI